MMYFPSGDTAPRTDHPDGLTMAAELYIMLVPADQLYAPATVPRDGTD
jgi:hypothetical protein